MARVTGRRRGPIRAQVLPARSLVTLGREKSPLPEPGGLDAEGLLLFFDPTVTIGFPEAAALLLDVVDQLVEQNARMEFVFLDVEPVVEENRVPVQVHRPAPGIWVRCRT
jgi:hypothetical protein